MLTRPPLGGFGDAPEPHHPEPRPADSVLAIDARARTAVRGGQRLDLKDRAFDLLVALARRAGEVVDATTLERELWPGRRVSESSLRMQVALLRRQIGPECLPNVAGRGYRLALPVRWADVAAVQPAHRQRVPALPGQLLGRDADRDHLSRQLHLHRLLSLLGPGGIGKTRLAQVAARDFEQQTQGVALWVDLAPVAATAVGAALAQACGLQLPPAAPALSAQVLARSLEISCLQAPVLLVIDNAEHRVDVLRPLLRELLAEAPTLRVLVTSQVALRLPQEQAHWLPPLGLPAERASADEIRRSPAVQLLAERAKAADQRWTLDEAELPVVADLVRSLEGMALAIEMAAVRLPLLGARALQRRLADGLRALGGLADAEPPRHRTLRATLDWSFDLLGPDEHRALRQLSVFAAPFRLETAVQVVQLDGHDRNGVEQVVQALVDRSMLQLQPSPAPDLPARLRLLDSVRQHAAEALQRAGVAEHQACGQRHAAALAELAEQACADFLVASDAQWAARWLPDHADLAQAFDATHQQGHAGQAAALIDALVLGANVTGDLAPALQRWQATRELAVGAEPLARARLLGWGNMAGDGLTRRGQSERRVAAWRALPQQQGQQGLQGLCVALAMHAVTCQDSGDAAAADAALAECQALERADWPPRLRRRCSWIALTRLAVDHPGDGLAQQARRSSDELARELAWQGAWREVSLIRGQQALLLRLHGQFMPAVALLRDTARLQQELGCGLDAGRSLGQASAAWLDAMAAQEGAASGLAQALDMACQALQLVQPYPAQLLYFVDALAELALRVSSPRVAAQALAAGDALRATLQWRTDRLDQGARQRIEQALPSLMGADERARCVKQGSELSVETLRRLLGDRLAAACAAEAAAPPHSGGHEPRHRPD